MTLADSRFSFKIKVCRRLGRALHYNLFLYSLAVANKYKKRISIAIPHAMQFIPKNQFYNQFSNQNKVDDHCANFIFRLKFEINCIKLGTIKFIYCLFVQLILCNSLISSNNTPSAGPRTSMFLIIASTGKKLILAAGI